ncbi:MAG: hypothetical protein MK193_02410 [Lentisphaeria bacterium]|nr:hypothetical protein [Lentisphaeria bacterium]
MKNNFQEHLVSLEQICRSRHSTSRLANIFLALAASSLVTVFLIQSLEKMEETSFYLALISGVILTPLIIYLVNKNQSKLSKYDIVKILEKTHPVIFKEQLYTAYTLSEKEIALSPIEEYTVEQATHKLTNCHPVEALNDKLPSTIYNSTKFILCFFLFFTALNLSGFQKIYWGAYDLIRGEKSGMTVSPGSVEIASGSNLTIHAQLHRGFEQKLQIGIYKNGRYQVFPMVNQGVGLFEFQFFNLSDITNYEIIGTDFKSPNYQIQAIQVPDILNFSVLHISPDYTQVSPKAYESPNLLRVLPGSELKLNVTTNGTGSVYLLKNNETKEFLSGNGLQHEKRLIVSEAVNYQVYVSDTNQKISQKWFDFNVKLQKDNPPVIKFIFPNEEFIQRDRVEDVSFLSHAEDDYGVQTLDLVLSINGLLSRRIPLYGSLKVPGQKEINSGYSLNLTGLVEFGDIIYYHIESKDYSHEAKQSRSNLQYIEIRPELPDNPPIENDQEGGEPHPDLSLTKLIEETKRLIQKNFDIQDKQDQFKQLLPELAQDIGALKLATQQQYNKIREHFLKEGKLPDGWAEEFDLIDDEQQESISRLTPKERPDQSIKYLQSTLSRMLKMEIEIQRHMTKVKSKSSDPSKSSKSDSTNKENEEEGDKEKSEEDQLKEALKELERLEMEQDQLSQSIERSPSENQQHAQNQQRLQKDVEQLQKDLKPEFPAESQHLQGAIDQMKQTESALNQNESDQGAIYSKRAEDKLAESMQLLSTILEQMQGSDLARAAAGLKQIQDKQEEWLKELAYDEELTRKQGRSLSNKELELEENLQELKSELQNQLLDKLDRNPGESAANLQKGLQQLEDSEASKSMKKAANAIRFRRKDKAKSEGEKASSEIAELQKLVKDLESKLPPSLRELSQLARKLGAMDGQTLSEEVQQTKLEEISDKAQIDIPDELQQGIASDLGKIKQFLNQQIEQKILEKIQGQKGHFRKFGDQQLPDEYRQQIEDYFESLNNGDLNGS